MSNSTKNIVTVNSIDQLNEEAWAINRSHPKTALTKAKEALLMAEKLNYSKGKGEAIATIGACNLWLGNYDESLENSMEAVLIFEDINTYVPLGRVKYTIGTSFFYISDYDNALQYYLESLESYHNGNFERGKADAYNGIGSVYYAINENEKSLNYLKKSKKICEDLQAFDILQKVLDGMGQAYINLQQYEDARKALDLCLEVLDENDGSRYVKAHCLNKLGTVHLLQNRPDVALDYFQQSLTLREEDEFYSGVAECLNNIGKAKLDQKEDQIAEDYFYRAFDLAKKYKARNIEVEATFSLAELYEKQGNTKKALKYFKDFHYLRDKVRSDNANRKTKGLELRFKVEQERSEKLLLQRQNDQLKKYSDDLVKLGEIGQSLMALLSVEKIIAKAQEKLSRIMDATSFGMALYDESKQELTFPGYIEDGKIFPKIVYDVSIDEPRLANICFRKKLEIVTNNFSEDYHKWVKTDQAPKAGKGTQSIIYIPFEIKGGSSGVVTVQSFKKHQYEEHHVNMLRNLTVYMASALENALLYQSLEQKVEDRTQEIRKQKEDLEQSYKVTAMLNEVGQQLTSSTNFDTIFKRLHASVDELMDAACFGVRLFKPETNEIEYKFEIEKGQIDEESFTVSMENEDNYSVICVKNNQVIHINDNLKEYKKYTKEIIVPTGEMPHSLIFHPMSIGDRVVGLITVQSFQKNAFTKEHVEIIKTLASFTAIALDNVNILENLEQTVQKRTAEVVAQKEEIEKTYKDAAMLSEIGWEINTILSFEDIVGKIYEKTNQVMDCTIFGIGVVNEAKNCLELKGAYERGEKLPDLEFDLNDNGSLTTWCIKNSKEIVILDYFKDIENYIKIGDKTSVKAGERPESIIYIPLITKGKTIGTISVQSFESNAYTDYHINLVRNLALYAATAIENAGLYAEMEQKIEERTAEVVAQKEEIEKTYENTRLLSQIGQEVIASHDLEGIFENVEAQVNKLMKAEMFSIRVCDYKTNEIEYTYTMEKGQRMPKVRVSLDDIDNYSVWVVRNNQEIFINDHQKEYKKYTKNIVVVHGDLPESLIFCPLVVKDKIIGVISAQAFQKNAYSEYHLDILRSLGAYLAIAIENANILENLEDTVKERTLEVVQQKEIIEEKNKDITDSIRYAQRIQSVILPSLGDFQNTFKDSFVLFKPRDIVSGDFYWLEKIDNKVFFTVVDCTGHGVPGALVSLVGANGLNRCINEFGLRKPAAILDKLKEIVTDTFANTGSSTKDGMDMALCCIDFDNNQMEYAGANNPLWILREKDGTPLPYETTENKTTQIIEIKPDKQPVGQYEEFQPFTNHIIEIKPNDRIYLFTDGFADQFGGKDIHTRKKGGKKFKYSNLKNLIFDLQNIEMKDQLKHFDNTFESWKGDFEQVDDVCLIGIEV
ncbi:MAG: GAF domain-containing protein [Crocinitomicaceae bacterium]